MPLKPWPYNHIQKPSPADWGIGMTVCIAAHCATDKCIVLASDMMISTVDMSADLAAMKMYPIGRHWVAQFAGDDTSQITALLNDLRDDMGHESETLAFVSNTFTAAYAVRLRRKIETGILGPIGYTFEEFKEHGLAQLGQEAFSRVFYDIQQQRLELEILVSGFHGDQPHIFAIRTPGKVTYYSQLGFWAIGSGETHALGSFFNARNPLSALDRSSTLYRVCEAKFNAENAVGVGSATSVMIVYPDGSRLNPSFDEIEALKREWQRTRVMTVPDVAKALSISILKRADEEKLVPPPLTFKANTKRKKARKRIKPSASRKSTPKQ